MRLRIQTYAPLPDLKAWFLPTLNDGQDTILDLKDNLCSRVQVLKDGHYRAKDLLLSLEGFELLNDSPIGAVRDGDLLCVKLSPKSVIDDIDFSVVPRIPNEKKRKRTASTSKPTSVKPVRMSTSRAKVYLDKREETSSDDDSSDSDASSASSSSSSTSSSSASSSHASSSEGSSSTSESSRPPKARSSKAPKLTVPTPSTSKATTTTNHIPPGHGKPTTHSRNKRRRKKREFEKLGKSAPTVPGPSPPNGSSETNILPLGPARGQLNQSETPVALAPVPTILPTSEVPVVVLAPKASEDVNGVYVTTQREPLNGPAPTVAPKPVYITPDQVMMGSLRNKNKKKGFKQSIAAPIPQKIIFADHSIGSDYPTFPLAATEVEQSVLIDAKVVDHSLFHAWPRLVPPSERQEQGQLPSNISVTSVDVEAGMWDKPNLRKKRKSGKGKHVEYPEDNDYWYGEAQSAPSGYPEPAGPSASARSNTTDVNGFDWSQAEALWDKGSVILQPEQLVAGSIVGWKELGINPQTFTPEVLLSVARVVKVDLNVAPMTVSFQSIERPGASEAALSFGFGSVDKGMDCADEAFVETSSWPVILEGQWRCISVG